MSEIYIYNYDFNTKEFLSSQLADKDSEASMQAQEFIPMVPAYATLIKPLPAKPDKTNVFDENNNEWKLVSDYRGKYMINSEMIPEEVKDLGDLPQGYVIITNEQIALLNQYGKNYFIIAKDKLIVNPKYDTLEELERRKNFESTFIETLWGWYRKNPKGYSNAPQSIDIIDRLVTKFDGFTEAINTMMLFYEKPDFSDVTQCTEEWLIAHQYKHGICTKEEFDAFYLDFQTRWALDQYK